MTDLPTRLRRIAEDMGGASQLEAAAALLDETLRVWTELAPLVDYHVPHSRDLQIRMEAVCAGVQGIKK